MARRNVEAERRLQILESTCEVIANQGMSTLRVADVAKQAGVSPGIIHYYFDNKQGLIRAAFEQNFQHSLERRAAILHSDNAPIEKLRDFVNAYLPSDSVTTNAWRVWAELWVASLHDRELSDLNDRAYGEWRRILAGLVRDCQVAGQIAESDAVHIANLLVGLLDGLALQVLVGSHAMTLERMRDTCERFIDQLSV